MRLPADGQTSLEDLESDERVRWVGQHQPGWRLEPSLLTQPAHAQALAVLPTSDLGVGGYAQLATDLVHYGAAEASCDAWMCHAIVEPSMLALWFSTSLTTVVCCGPNQPSELRVHNALAWSIAGVQNVANNATFTLDGSGEMIAIADTGLDQNHPDLTGRVAATYTQFGLDPSLQTATAGTELTLPSLSLAMAPAMQVHGVLHPATLVMYALEHDPTGTFGRIGSIYDMLRDAEQMTARLSVNAWGLNGNYGQYTADARSVDTFVHDRKDLTPVFSVGDRGTSGASQVSSPATAKNVIAIGASTTGASGTPQLAPW